MHLRNEGVGYINGTQIWQIWHIIPTLIFTVL